MDSAADSADLSVSENLTTTLPTWTSAVTASHSGSVSYDGTNVHAPVLDGTPVHDPQGCSSVF